MKFDIYKPTRPLFDKNDTYSLRGVCMILIILHHLFQYTFSRYGVQYNTLSAIILQSLGYLATGVFFLISGFGLSKSIDKNTPLSNHYVIKNLWKLLSPFVFISVFDIICSICDSSFSAITATTNLLTLSLSYGGSLWFMKVIFCLYLLTFTIFRIIRDKRVASYSMMVIVVMYIIMAAYFRVGEQWFNSIICFPLGILYANIDTIYIKRNNYLITNVLKMGGYL